MESQLPCLPRLVRGCEKLLLVLIQTQPELLALCERLQGVSIICLDTEFAREGRYFAQPGTIQLAAGAELALIDAVAIRDFSCLKPFLANPDIVKVFHAGEQDLEILYRLLGCPVAPVFDTQLAAAFLGYGEQLSLSALLQITVGEQIRKLDTFTDWLRRPLNAGQIEYALDDVRHLERAYRKLLERLQAVGRLDWVREDCRSLESLERLAPPDEQSAYLRVSGAARLNSQALGRLQELAAWRELKARRLNVPTKRLVIDPVLTSLALRPPASVRELAGMRGLSPGQLDRFGAEMVAAVERGARNTPPPIERTESCSPELDATVDLLSVCLRTISREQSISATLLANRQDLRLLAAQGEAAEIPLLSGWRRGMAGTALLNALAGKVIASISPATKQVRLEWFDGVGSAASTASGAAGQPSEETTDDLVQA